MKTSYEQETALDRAIEHWERLASCRSVVEIRAEGLLADNCPLCRAFEGCEGCPVAEATGKTDCYGSPWGQAYRYFRGRTDAKTPHESATGLTLLPFVRETWAQLAGEELEFLRGLRQGEDS